MKIISLIVVLLMAGCAKVPPSRLQPGLQFFVDIDEVRFVCSRSFHDEIEIVVKRPNWEPSRAPMLVATIYPVPRWQGEKREPIEVKKKISEEVFTELRNYVTRQDLIEHSLTESPISTDGSMWPLEGRKGGISLFSIGV